MHLAQANKSLQKAKNNNYSDKQKQKYQDDLIKLFSCVQQKVEANQNVSIGDPFIDEIKQILYFIYKSLEFLDSSTLNLIPYETVECLKLALRDWVDDSDTYIIVTSLINSLYGFSFDPSLLNTARRYKNFKDNYGVEFTSGLIQINIPVALSRDYLASVVNYHELGHFVDRTFAITPAITKEIFSNYKAGTNMSTIQGLYQYFPFLNNNQYPDDTKQSMLYYHFGEFFCDIFASQYAGKSLNQYLSYITSNNPNFSMRHPATTIRTRVVDEFIGNVPSPLVTVIKDAVRQITSKNLSIRFVKPSPDDIYNLLPPTINDASQLHGLLAVGWDIWTGDWQPFRASMKTSLVPDRDTVYNILNNLIEKSIGNFIVVQKWNQSH